MSGLLYSPTSKVKNPRRVNTALVQRINLVFSDHREGLNLWVAMSDRVKYPMLPAIIKMVTMPVDIYP